MMPGKMLDKTKTTTKKDDTTPVQEDEKKEFILVGLNEKLRAMPNHIARSSLFAPVAKGFRHMHDGTVLVSRSDCRIEYWGKQLNEQHADIVFQLLFQSRLSMGDSVSFIRSNFLKQIGWGISGREYERFNRYMKELTSATFSIVDTTKNVKIGRTHAFHMLSGFDFDDTTETYTYKLDPRWVQMFSNREYALLNWQKRLEIGAGQNMAKSLQRLFAASSDNPQRYSIDFLKDRAQYTGRMRDFISSLESALNKLQELKLINKWMVGASTRQENQLTIWNNMVFNNCMVINGGV